MASGIYEIRNTLNGKRYIGSAVEFGNRWRVHAQSLQRGDHHSRALQRAWIKYTPRAFQFNKLLECAPKNLLMYEQALIDGYKPEYNCSPTAGSRLGMKATEESRAKMRASRRKDFSPMTGKRHSESTKAKISAKKSGVPSVPCSDEKKAKLSAVHKGRVITAEQRAKISATLMGHKQSADQIEKRMQKLRGRKMPEGFAEGARARMLGSKASKEAKFNMGKARAALTEDQVREVRKMLSEGVKQKAIALAMSIPHPTVADISCGRKYKWVAM